MMQQISSSMPTYLESKEPAGQVDKAKYWLVRGLPDEEIITKGINKNTVRIARSWLVRDGFLRKDGEHYLVIAGPMEGASFIPFTKSRQRHSNGEKVITSGGHNLSNVYFIADTESRSVKIGVSKEPIKRVLSIQTHNPNKLELLDAVYDVPISLEKELHNEFMTSRLSGEWFRYYLPGDNILLRLGDKLVRYTIPKVSSITTLGNAKVDNAVMEA